MSEFKAVEWRSGRDTVGIVLRYDSMVEKYIAFIGVAKGLDENADIEYIYGYGAKLTFREAVAFFPYLKEEEYK